MPALGPHAPRNDAKPKSRPKPKVRVKRPSAASRARAQEQAYKSQGRAVEKQANTQRRARVRRQHEAKDTKGAEDMGRARKYIQSKYKDKRAVKLVEKTIGHPVAAEPDVTGREYRRKQKEAREGSIAKAPVGRVLEQTTRPVHGVMGGIRAAERGENVLKAAKRGVQNKDKYTASDVFSEVGWKPKGGLGKALKGAASLVADVGLDPTTYATGGTASVVRKSTIKSAEKQVAKTTAASTTRKVTDKEARRAAARSSVSHKTGMSKAGAESPDLAERALRRAMNKSPGKGITVSFAGKEVPGVRRATEVTTRPVRRVARKTPGRGIVSNVNPNMAAKGVAKADHMAAVTAARNARAKTSHGEHEAQQVALGIYKRIGEKNYQLVVDAIEAGRIKDLPEHLRGTKDKPGPAIFLRDQFRHAARMENLGKRERKNYVPHPLTPEGIKAVQSEEIARRGMGKGFYTKKRKREGTMAELREKFPGEYEQDLAKVTHQRLGAGSRDVARAELNRDLAAIGRDVKRPQIGEKPKPLNLQEGEALFHIKRGEPPRLVTDRAEIARVQTPLRLNKKGTKVKNAQPKSVEGGRYVVLNKDLVETAMAAANPHMALPKHGAELVRALDKGQAAFKATAIATLGFHVRNFLGDSAQAYLGQPGHHIPGNMVRAGRVLKAYKRQEAALAKLTPEQVGKVKLKTGRYGAITYDEAAQRLRNAGAFRSGFIARELPELEGRVKPIEELGRVRRPLRKVRVKVGESKLGMGTKRAMLAREDIPRLTTAIEMLRGGATFEQAAQAVANLHFDYQHLTWFERNVMRRAMPFYTWSARNIPLQTKMVVARPGKYANFQKIREEAIKASGAEDKANEAADYYEQLEALGVKLPKDWQKGLSEWEQRNASIPVTIAGKTFTVSAGLPVQDLNEFPGAALSHQLDEYWQRGVSQTTPLAKDLVEYFENHSFFFRDQLERDNSPLVPAPEYVKSLPDWLKKAAWVRERTDPRTGKKTLMWRGKADYLIKTIPGTPQYLNQLATQSDRRGRGQIAKLMGWAGVRSSPYDPLTNAINIAYAAREEATKLRNTYESGTPEYVAQSQKIKALNQIIYRGKSERGDAKLPRVGAPSKRSAPKWSDGGNGVKWSDQQSGVKWTD